jgi:hypothetical protein
LNLQQKKNLELLTLTEQKLKIKDDVLTNNWIKTNLVNECYSKFAS